MLGFKMWWPTALTPATNQTCHSDLLHGAGSVMCDGAGHVLTEHFCLPFRATLRKLRPEDMFETWVSTRGWEALRPLLVSNKKPLLKSSSLWLGKTLSSLPCKATSPPLGRRESLGYDAQCLSSNGVLKCFAQQWRTAELGPVCSTERTGKANQVCQVGLEPL